MENALSDQLASQAHRRVLQMPKPAAAGFGQGREPMPAPVAALSVRESARRQRITKGRRPRNRARLMAAESSRCFLAETAVMREGTILPRSEM